MHEKGRAVVLICWRIADILAFIRLFNDTIPEALAGGPHLWEPRRQIGPILSRKAWIRRIAGEVMSTYKLRHRWL